MNIQFDKGSITVEAAFIVPLSLAVICAVLVLCFHIHNEAWYTAAAGEVIITGATYAAKEDNDVPLVMKQKIAQLNVGSGFPYSGQGMVDVSTIECIAVRAQGQTNQLFGKGHLNMKVFQQIKVIRPVAWVRKMQAATLIKE